MKLNRTDYVLERASDGGYYVGLQSKDIDFPTPNLLPATGSLWKQLNEMIDEMYMVEEFI